MLTEVFRYSHKQPSTQQTTERCQSLVNAFVRFLNSIVPTQPAIESDPYINGVVPSIAVSPWSSPPAPQFSTGEHKKLVKVTQPFRRTNELSEIGDVGVTWFPVYGCSLRAEVTSVAAIVLKLVFPDGWTHVQHFLPSGECVHSAVPTKIRVLMCGQLDPACYADFDQTLQHELDQARTRTGSQRSAATNDVGHQKTPQFIAAIVKKALAAVDGGCAGSFAPRGGTTDVGQHTGGQPRDTCWPVVAATLQCDLRDGGLLWLKALASFELSLLQTELRSVEQGFQASGADGRECCVTKQCNKIDDAFFMLQAVARRSVALMDVNHDVSELQKECDRIRGVLDNLVGKASRLLVRVYTLPDTASLTKWCGQSETIQLALPSAIDLRQTCQSSSEVHQYAMINLGHGDFVDASSIQFADFSLWVNSTKASQSPYALVVVLRSVESFIISMSKLLDECWPMTQCLPRELQQLMTEYAACVDLYSKLPSSNAHLVVEQHSAMLVVKWIGFCLVHQWCCTAFPLLRQFNIALDWTNLGVAVLSDRATIEALQHVAQYIRAWNSKTRLPIFHLSKQEGTIQFARQYSASDATLRQHYEQDQQAWRSKVDAMWNMVLGKQQKAKTLRQAIAAEEVELADSRSELKEAQQDCRYDSTWYERDRIRNAKATVRGHESTLKSLRAQLNRALQMPSSLVKALPYDETEALTILFFLDMPRELEILGEVCISAQLALCPMQPSKEMKTVSKTLHGHTTWLEHVTKNRASGAPSFSVKTFPLSRNFGSIPQDRGPRTVDGVSSKSSYENHCVWSPTFGTSCMRWTSPHGYAVDPFGVTIGDVRRTYTEPLPRAFAQLQWMNDYPGGATRGNMVYALPEHCPIGFDKEAYTTLGSLRAFPNQQVRKLLCALRADTLPWSHPCVETIVRQSLYQVGVLTDEDTPKMWWKTDLFVVEDGMVTFIDVLDDLAAKLEQTPRAFEQIPLLSELASFACQFDDSSRSRQIIARFTRMARVWAERMLASCEGLTSSLDIAERRAKECMLYGFAMVGYCRMEHLEPEVLRELCELVVLFHTSMLFADHNTSLRPRLEALERRVYDVMSRHIAAIVESVISDEMLTSLLRLVFPTAPTGLMWASETAQSISSTISSRFYALDAGTSTHYAVNLFTGSVLTNGNSPGGLPENIRSHKRFKVLFGGADFEVNPVYGAFHTVRTYGGVHYEFALRNSELVVNELLYAADDERSIQTLQLCCETWIDEHFGKVYPVRLRDLHSHWYWVKEGCVLLRSPVASDRRVNFVVHCDPTSSYPSCYQVPTSDVQREYADLIQRLPSYDRFILLGDLVPAVLSKLEARKYIHVLSTPGGTIRVELPRFNLSFVLDGYGNFASEQYAGYYLSREQQLGGFLPRFVQYLLLQSYSPTPFKAAKVRMLAPCGLVKQHSATGMMEVDVSKAHDAGIHVVCYDEHRRLGTFTAETVSARLQLSAIYASGGTSVPCAKLGMTGAEAAIQQLRCCSSSRPYSANEKALLLNVIELGYREPSIKLLAASLFDQANRLSVLFESESRCHSLLATCTDEAGGYAAMCVDDLRRCRLRYQLPDDDDRVLNPNSEFNEVNSVARDDSTRDKAARMENSPVLDTYVQDTETKLALLVGDEGLYSSDIPTFPLSDQQSSVLSRDMYRRLKESWQSFHQQRKRCVDASRDILREQLAAVHVEVGRKCDLVERYLNSSYNKATTDQRTRLLRSMNYVAILTRADIVRCALTKATVGYLAPRLKQDAQYKFHRGAIQLLELWVLQDKLERIIDGITPPSVMSTSQLIDELSCIRQWKSVDHPYWLAFEVEGRLQIRHEQYVVATHLLSESGTLCQLNMGRGKTRVILPMLFLHLGYNKNRDGVRRRATRANFLSALTSEARHFLQRFLVASSNELRIQELPFHRRIRLDHRMVQLLAESITNAKRRGDVLMVAPEHRMSLELKLVEMAGCEVSLEPARRQLGQILDNKHYHDVLDESDAVLHHKYHLVYAAGMPQGLDCGTERWEAAEALLRVVASQTSSHVARILAAENVSCSCFEYAARLGAYDGMRLNPPAPIEAANTTNLTEMSSSRCDLKRAVVEDLLDSPPFEYEWAATFCKKDGVFRSRLVRVLTDASVGFDEIMSEYESLLGSFGSRLLALRGFVASGVLEHCLEMRYRVQFGLPDPGNRPKRLAIPFRAADVPSERSEFSHPDVAITLTLLAYYHAGLRDNEVHETFSALLRLDASEQVRRYGQWFASVSAVGQTSLTAEERATLNDVHHLSLSDTRQFSLVCRVFRFCMETINFFLNTIVFPRETQQYPQRFTRSAWHLAANEDAIVGFSGTNDNQLLLPLSVTQREPDDAELRATNGKMLNLILKASNGCEVVTANDGKAPGWQLVLEYALGKGAQALIDTGALLAGVTSNDAAAFAAATLRRDGHHLQGVTYFDSRKNVDCWMVLEKSGGEEATIAATPLASASLTERDTFVIFDEARTRGADMKLRVDASAVVTLGPRLTKDKLMQGAGRMRQLGCDQTLRFVSFGDVAQQISRDAEFDVDGVLNWVMANTTAEATRGLVEWAGSGLQFERARRDSAGETIVDDWSLKTLYAGGHQAEMIAKIVQKKVFALFGDAHPEMARAIAERALTFGLDDEMLVAAHTDECERELLIEEQREEEYELQRPASSPVKEKDWDYRCILTAGSVRDLDGIVATMDVAGFASSIALDHDGGAELLRRVAWPEIKCTANFQQTVSMSGFGGSNRDKLSVEYLRVVDAMLLFRDGSVLLLSEFEADDVLALLWGRLSSVVVPSGGPTLCNLAMALQSVIDMGSDHVPFAVCRSVVSPWEGIVNMLRIAVACALLNGETMFSTKDNDAVDHELRVLLAQTPHREESAQAFVGARGRGHRWTRSALHELARRMDLEASINLPAA